MNNKQGKKLRGSALIYGLVIMTTVAIILTSIIGFVASQTKYAITVHTREQAFQIAEAGIHFYKWYLAKNTDGRTTSQIQAFWTSGAYGVGTAYEAEYFDPSGGAVGKYQISVTPPSTGSTVVTVRSVGIAYKDDDVPRTIEVRFRRPSWSEYILLSDTVTRFGAGTETFGKIHSNYGIRFDGLAHNLVTSSVASYNDPDHVGGNELGVHTHVNAPPGSGVNNAFRPLEAAGVTPLPDRPDVFEGGRQLSVATVDFNGVLGDLNYIKGVAIAETDGSKYFDNAHQGRHIILKTDGTFDIRTVQSFNSSTNEINNYSGGWTNYPIPNEGVIFVENHIWLEGSINGKRTTIVAANLISSALKDVYIGKDIRYTNYDCSDMLGIIGQSDVMIYEGSETDLRIDGALLAQTDRVGRPNYGTSDHKDVITIYGAIASNERYGFSWTNGTLNWGYTARNLLYDNNLLYCPPPYFPTGTQYVMDLWEEK